MKHALLFASLLMASFASCAQTSSFTAVSDTVCQDSCITFINTSTGSIDSIRWSAPGHVISDPHRDTITLCYPSLGRDSVRLFVYHAGSIDSSTQIISTNPVPHPRIRYFAPNACCYVVGTYQGYQWYESEAPTLIPGATDSTYSAGMGGWFVIADSNGCRGKSNIGFVMEGIHDANYGGQDIKIYPNPATSEITVSADAPIRNVIINTPQGRSVIRNDYKNDNVHISVADLPNGAYIIRINGSEVRKFVKE